MLRNHLTRRRLGLVLAVVAGVVLGAVVGQPGNGGAASQVVPKNTKLPTISGAVAVGQTLVGTRGTWSGSPTSFHFQWSRCDGTGAACLAISGATGKIYTITNVDVNNALRLTVTARNASGDLQLEVAVRKDQEAGRAVAGQRDVRVHPEGRRNGGSGAHGVGDLDGELEIARQAAEGPGERQTRERCPGRQRNLAGVLADPCRRLVAARTRRHGNPRRRSAVPHQ